MATKKYRVVEIQAASNGFVAVPDRRFDRPNDGAPYVFETFESLQKWLRSNLVPLGDE